jgi:uncharacterized protein
MRGGARFRNPMSYESGCRATPRKTPAGPLPLTLSAISLDRSKICPQISVRERRNICARLHMAKSALVDAGFTVALLGRRDGHHAWAVAQATNFPPPWSTCEAALSETFHLLGPHNSSALISLLRRGALVVGFDFARNQESLLKLMHRYSDVPMSLADACLVRMTELLANAVLLTTDTDFHIYRRNGRQVIPCVTPE